MKAGQLTDRRVQRIMKQAQSEISQELDVSGNMAAGVAEEPDTSGKSLPTGGQSGGESMKPSSSLLARLKQRYEQPVV